MRPPLALVFCSLLQFAALFSLHSLLKETPEEPESRRGTRRSDYLSSCPSSSQSPARLSRVRDDLIPIHRKGLHLRWR